MAEARSLRKIGAVALAWLALLFSSAPARAQETTGPPLLAGPVDGLSSAQTERLRDIHDRFRAAKDELREKIRRRRHELVEALSGEDPDRAAVKKAFSEIMHLQDRQQQLIVDEYFDVMSVLRPDQKKRFRDRVLQRIMAGQE